ncbi:hypothetical protein BJ878DRAFT_514517 [Calycina marina]|uniref:Major facilitator superfamily (MFS) profile domain-containing protein n=1 Tax=Calycina marina TaxID=1763456 RepID=A0A9P7YZM9_9HELO|nr:hypothetical protein BJ878DRAFT_514517 [Calycina marina]
MEKPNQAAGTGTTTNSSHNADKATVSKIVAGDENSQQEDVPWKASRREWAIMACLVVIDVAVAIDASILAPVLPYIAAERKANSTNTFWIGTSYLLTSTVIQPYFSNLSDVFEHRSV